MKAALQSHAMAQFDLATAFLEGRGVPQDSMEALKWYRKAAYIGGVEMARERLEQIKAKIPPLPAQETAIIKLLRSLGIEEYEDVFIKEEIDIEVVQLLSDDDLRGLGLLLGPRKKLLRALHPDGKYPVKRF